MSSSSNNMRWRNHVGENGLQGRGTWETSNSRCRCGDVARIWTSWTTRNPGRRFISCPNFQDPQRNCNFFRWIDPEIEYEAYRNTMYEMKVQTRNLQREHTDAMELLKKTKMRLMLMQKTVVVLLLMMIILVVLM